MESSNGIRSSITHAAVLWEVILDIRRMYTEAVQNHNPPVDHDAFWQTAVYCISLLWLWAALGSRRKLKDWNLSLKLFVLSCQEMDTFWPLTLTLGRVPYTILLRMWSYISDTDIPFQRYSVEETSQPSNCLIFLVHFSWVGVFLLPIYKVKVYLEMVH